MTRTTMRPSLTARSESARVFTRGATELTSDAEEMLRADEDFEAWLDARVAEAIDAQDDAEVVARAYGPEPEFMVMHLAGDCGGR